MAILFQGTNALRTRPGGTQVVRYSREFYLYISGYIVHIK